MNWCLTDNARNREDRKKSVKLHLALKEDDHIYITVEDEGPGYDYKQVIESCELSMKETGRGILIVRELSERLIFNNAGNRITVVKRVWH